MASPTPNDEPSSSPQESSSTPNPPQRSNDDLTEGRKLAAKVREEMMVYAAAHQNDPPRRKKDLPSEQITSGDSSKPRHHGGPIRLLSINGELTELGKRKEQERLAKLAATATSDEGGKESTAAGSEEASAS
jgi:hypothetical protein